MQFSENIWFIAFFNFLSIKLRKVNLNQNILALKCFFIIMIFLIKKEIKIIKLIFFNFVRNIFFNKNKFCDLKLKKKWNFVLKNEKNWFNQNFSCFLKSSCLFKSKILVYLVFQVQSRLQKSWGKKLFLFKI